jgi:hypothetical protein
MPPHSASRLSGISPTPGISLLGFRGVSATLAGAGEGEVVISLAFAGAFLPRSEKRSGPNGWHGPDLLSSRSFGNRRATAWQSSPLCHVPSVARRPLSKLVARTFAGAAAPVQKKTDTLRLATGMMNRSRLSRGRN